MRLTAILLTAIAAGSLLTAAPAHAAPTYAQLQQQVRAEKAKAAKAQRLLARERRATAALRRDLRAARRDRDIIFAQLQRTENELESGGVAVAVTAERDSLRAQVATLTGERDQARANFELAKQGAEGAVRTMTLPEMFALLGVIYSRFPSGGTSYDASVFASGSYRSYTFTRY